MSVFRKTLQLKACQASKGKNLTSSFIFITKGDNKILLLSCLIHLKFPFVYYGNRKFK